MNTSSFSLFNGGHTAEGTDGPFGSVRAKWRNPETCVIMHSELCKKETRRLCKERK